MRRFRSSSRSSSMKITSARIRPAVVSGPTNGPTDGREAPEAAHLLGLDDRPVASLFRALGGPPSALRCPRRSSAAPRPSHPSRRRGRPGSSGGCSGGRPGAPGRRLPSCCVTTQPTPPSADERHDHRRPAPRAPGRCGAASAVTTGVRRNASSTASATGTRIACARYSTTPTSTQPMNVSHGRTAWSGSLMTEERRPCPELSGRRSRGRWRVPPSRQDPSGRWRRRPCRPPCRPSRRPSRPVPCGFSHADRRDAARAEHSDDQQRRDNPFRIRMAIAPSFVGAERVVDRAPALCAGPLRAGQAVVLMLRPSAEHDRRQPDDVPGFTAGSASRVGGRQAVR